MAHLTFPNFEDIVSSTNTFVIMTNLTINTDELYEKLPITEYVIVPTKRGRKKKVETVNPNINIKPGSIITVEKENKFRGVNLKCKEYAEGGKNFFRNSITIVMMLDSGKMINFKITKNGKFQMTGCKSIEHGSACVRYIWDFIKNDKSTYSFSDGGSELSYLIIPVMRNIDFPLNFTVDRIKLDSYINNRTDYHSLLETSSGYTGVNASFTIRKNIYDTIITKFVLKDDNTLEETAVKYEEFLKMLDPKERKKKEKVIAKKCNTFLIFQSGKTILSGLNADIMVDSYYEFIEMIRNCYSEVVEVLNKV